MSTQLARRYLFSVERYEQMVRSGILTPADRVELIEGEIVKKMSIGPRHADKVDEVGELLTIRTVLQGLARVRVQSTIRLDSQNSEPEPDITLLRRRPDFYRAGHPTPEDILLIVEVADSSSADDRYSKIPLYARAGIAEVWLFDLRKSRWEIYTQPLDGAYQVTRIVTRDDSITLQLLPEVTINASELL
jgi:Uma2 family endonuclease